ncbi:hypothetical protein ACO0QE_000657 [Hanseniaspora vineae]
MSKYKLPFADVPAILVADNKDDEVSSHLHEKLKDLSALLGDRSYLNQMLRLLHWDKDVSLRMVSRLLYLLVTVFVGIRTPGQQFADISYIGNTEFQGNFKARIKRLLYIFGCSGATAAVQKFLVKTFAISESVVETFCQLHLATFYMNAKYRSVWNRLFGFRYVLQHTFDSEEEEEYRKTYSHNYKTIGKLILCRLAYKILYPRVSQLFTRATSHESSKEKKTSHTKEQINLSDPLQLTYIPEASRTCILCSSEMISPSCGPCGHVFCWTCLVEWCKTRKNCPLCRQACLPQEVVPLR